MPSMDTNENAMDCSVMSKRSMRGNNARDDNNSEHLVTDYGKYENVRIIKNVIVLGFAFMIHFTAFHGTSNLQSSVNASAALGPLTLASIYGSLILSNIFLPAAVIRWLGCKWAITLSFIVYMPFIAAQFYPRFYTLIPAGLIVGFGGGPLWCAKCTYLSVVAEAFSRLTGKKIKSEVMVVRFFGLFFVFYQMAQVWGNLISSTVLSESPSTFNDTVGATPFLNTTVKNIGSTCGANFCPQPHATDVLNENLVPPDEVKIYTLSSIFLGCMVIAVLSVGFGVDSLERYDKGRKGSGIGLSGFKLLAVTLKQLSKRYQLLLLPITMFIGAEQAFVAVDFTSAFVACGWGISRIGYAMICFGIANALAAALAGGLTKLTGRLPVLVGVTILHTSLILWMRAWTPIENDYITYCTMAALWGLADGIWLVQVNALSGILFPGNEEAAYSNFRLWESTGSVITYALSPVLCAHIKLCALIVLMLIGMICYGSIEYFESKAKKGLKQTKDFVPVIENEDAADTRM